ELGREVVKIPDSCMYYRTYYKPLESRSGRRNSERMNALRSVMLIYKRHARLYSYFPEISEKYRKYETEINSGVTMKIKNLVFPLRYKLSCLVS
ncbi:MAG: hypothetical protein ACM3RX_01150, partial [Methanococcaceae archaeon]